MDASPSASLSSIFSSDRDLCSEQELWQLMQRSYTPPFQLDFPYPLSSIPKVTVRTWLWASKIAVQQKKGNKEIKECTDRLSSSIIVHALDSGITSRVFCPLRVQSDREITFEGKYLFSGSRSFTISIA